MRSTRVAITALSLFSVSAISVAADTPTDVADSPKYLLLDSRIIESTDGVALRLGKVEKDPHNPLFGEDKPWEPRYDNMYPNVMFDEEEKTYKCWYSPFIVDKATSTATEKIKQEMSYCARLSQVHEREMAVCYATSKDGIVWEKPELGICDYEGSKKNNIVKRNVHGVGVFKDSRESDPARRYKMFARGMSVAFSADGLHWTQLISCPEIDAAGDTHNNSFWDQRLGAYVGITRLWGDAGRVVARTESRDYRKWTKAQEVLRGLEPHLQPYAMPVFRFGNVYLGLATIFNARSDLVDCELAWSPDTVHWHRVCPGTPLIPRGAKGSYDWGCIYAAAYPVLRGDRIRLYYGGNDGPHCGWRKGFLCLAWLRPDGFAGMESLEPDAPGTIITKPIRCTGKKLRVSADARSGSLRVAVLDTEGFGLDDCMPITDDVTDGEVRWAGGRDLSALGESTVRLKFELESAKLYAFEFDGS